MPPDMLWRHFFLPAPVSGSVSSVRGNFFFAGLGNIERDCAAPRPFSPRHHTETDGLAAGVMSVLPREPPCRKGSGMTARQPDGASSGLPYTAWACMNGSWRACRSQLEEQRCASAKQPRPLWRPGLRTWLDEKARPEVSTIRCLVGEKEKPSLCCRCL